LNEAARLQIGRDGSTWPEMRPGFITFQTNPNDSAADFAMLLTSVPEA
jgi:hypothetical protein